MKKIIFAFAVFISIETQAQVKTYAQAIITTTMNVIAPEEEEVQNMGGGGEGRGGMNFRNMMDGETFFITYLKDNLVKTNIKSEMGKSTIFRDNEKKVTTTIIEMMGNKSGFAATDEEQAAMQKQRDSMMAERRKKDTSSNVKKEERVKVEPSTEISYTKESKKIAGYNCTKAYLITSRFLGAKDTSIIWVAPDFKLNNILQVGGMSAMPGMGSMMGGTLNGLEKVEGFVMGYEMKMRRGRVMEVSVTKIELDKAIDNKEFDLPKGIEIKPMKEMQNMFGGGRGGGGMRMPRD
jgi:hypothetical protein